MSIVRGKDPERYTIVNNDILENPNLSFKAKGLLAYIMSKPDHWQTNERHLATVGQDKRSSIASALKELERAGYLVRRKYHKDDGTFGWKSTIYRYPVQEQPQDVSPWLENPTTEKPSTENQAKVITDRATTDGATTEKETTTTNGGGSGVGLVFDTWQNNMPGSLTPLIVDKLNDFIDTYGVDEVLMAINVAVESNVRNVRYVGGILNRRAAGGEHKPAQPATNGKAMYYTDPLTGEKQLVQA